MEQSRWNEAPMYVAPLVRVEIDGRIGGNLVFGSLLISKTWASCTRLHSSTLPHTGRDPSSGDGSKGDIRTILEEHSNVR
jgi:hypothetical protein